MNGDSVRFVRERVARMSQPLSLATSSTGMEGVWSPRPHTGSTSCTDTHTAHLQSLSPGLPRPVTHQVRLVVDHHQEAGVGRRGKVSLLAERAVATETDDGLALSGRGLGGAGLHAVVARLHCPVLEEEAGMR